MDSEVIKAVVTFGPAIFLMGWLIFKV